MSWMRIWSRYPKHETVITVLMSMSQVSGESQEAMWERRNKGRKKTQKRVMSWRVLGASWWGVEASWCIVEVCMIFGGVSLSGID